MYYLIFLMAFSCAADFLKIDGRENGGKNGGENERTVAFATSVHPVYHDNKFYGFFGKAKDDRTIKGNDQIYGALQLNQIMDKATVDNLLKQQELPENLFSVSTPFIFRVIIDNHETKICTEIGILTEEAIISQNILSEEKIEIIKHIVQWIKANKDAELKTRTPLNF